MTDDELEDLERELLLVAVARRYGYDFRDYSKPGLRRRVQRAMVLEGLSTLSALQDRVLHDEAAFRRFLSCVSIQSTEMFRDRHVFRFIRRNVLPIVRTYPFIRVWHAGCSTGEEAYSTAILLTEEGLIDRSRIYATDLSVDLLDRASRGIFELASMRGHADAYVAAGGAADFSSYYIADGRYAIFKENLRRRITFSPHNLASDGTFNEFHLVFCRNVMIYFNNELKDRVHRLLYRSLVRLGILVLGLKESVQFTPHAGQYETLDDSLRVFRKRL